MKAFEKFKLAILTPIYLKHYNAALEIHIKTNAFNGIILKVLS